MLRLTYLSHSCFILDDNMHRVIIDPFITGNPTMPVKIGDIKADFIIVTHGHGDHLGDAFPISQRNDATIIAVNELANFASENGCKAHNMHIGGSRNFPFGRIKFTIAHHGSGSSEGRYLGEPAGVIVTMGGKTFYHTGDTSIFLDMKLIGELDKIDIMACCIGGNFTMDVDDAAKAVEFVNPGLVIPMHYDTFPVIETQPEKFKSNVESLGKKCRIMTYGETIEFRT